jgi:hypothetical protein
MTAALRRELGVPTLTRHWLSRSRLPEAVGRGHLLNHLQEAPQRRARLGGQQSTRLPELRRRRARDHRDIPGAAGGREGPHPLGVRSATATKGPGARGGARLKPPELRRPLRSPETSTPAAPPGVSRGDAALPVDSTPKDTGSTLISGLAGALRNVDGRSSRGKAPAQTPGPYHPGMHRPPFQGGLKPSQASQGPFEARMRAIGCVTTASPEEAAAAGVGANHHP